MNRLGKLIVAATLPCAAGIAHAGGLDTPGAGVVSTSRAGASVASTDDGEALTINPAGLAKAEGGTVITVAATLLDYWMDFKRTGTYDPIAESTATAQDHAYEGERYPTVTNKPNPTLGVGPYQPVPVVAIVSDLGGKVPGLHVAAGLFAPNGVPGRDMTHVGNNTFDYKFPQSDYASPPPPTRYDVLTETASVALPSIAAAYRILPNLDVGARFSLAFASLDSAVALWGLPGNYEEWDKQDASVHLHATENFIPVWGAGFAFRPNQNIEIGGNYNAKLTINAKGQAEAYNGSEVTLGGQAVTVLPVADAQARCAPGGTAAELKACVSLGLPQNAQLGGRYKFFDQTGTFRGDLELDVDWENWGDNQNNYTVTIDAQAAPTTAPNNGFPLKTSVIYHGFQDTYAARLGGSYIIPLTGADLILRGGLGYDTAAAMPGWERVDIDGAARTTVTVGAGYKIAHWRFDVGAGVILEGTRTNPGNCNPTQANMGCDGTGVDTPQAGRKGPDPTDPLLSPTQQAQDPINQGVIKSHYIELMLGATTWF